MSQNAQLEKVAQALGAAAVQVTTAIAQQLEQTGITEAELEQLAVATDIQKTEQNKAWYEQRVDTQQRQFKRY